MLLFKLEQRDTIRKSLWTWLFRLYDIPIEWCFHWSGSLSKSIDDLKDPSEHTLDARSTAGVLYGHLRSSVRNFDEPVHLVYGSETDPCAVVYVSQDAACKLAVWRAVLYLEI